MTLRDYFAAKAMAGMLAGGHRYWISSVQAFPDGARFAYLMADAMLKARQS